MAGFEDLLINLTLVGILILIIYALIEGLILYIAAKMVGAETVTYGRAVGAALSLAILVPIMFLFGSFILKNNLIGIVLAFLITILIIKSAFETSFGKAILILIIFFILNIVLSFVSAFLPSDVQSNVKSIGFNSILNINELKNLFGNFNLSSLSNIQNIANQQTNTETINTNTS
ncbi:MAG: hypothetical protein ACP5G1_01420 [Nanopusillaceae archaeon]